MEHPHALFPGHPFRELFDGWLTRCFTRVDQVRRTGSVVPTIDLNSFQQELSRFTFEDTAALQTNVEWLVKCLLHGSTHVTHPRYFGLFNPQPHYPAMVADRLVSFFNSQLATHTTSPVAVAIEEHTIKQVAKRLGMPESGGHFTTGGSEANYTALILALVKASKLYVDLGVRAFHGSPCFYVSKDCHLAWTKIAVEAGIGRLAVRFVDTIEGVMNMQSLRDQIAYDRKIGSVPVMIVATAGTTNAGMIDPLRDCKRIAVEENLWLHVDAAWGGAVMASDTLRPLLDGIADADSVTVDAHKWFATTMGCGMFLTAHPRDLLEAFNVYTTFMPSQRADDPYVTSMQWSRRFIGLRLFLGLATGGWQGFTYHVQHSLDLCTLLCKRLTQAGWVVVNQSKLGVVCFTPPEGSGDVRTVVQRVQKSGRAWISVAQFEGRDVIRACVTSGEATEEDIAILMSTLLHPATNA